MEKRSRRSVKKNAARAAGEIAYPLEKRCPSCGETKKADEFHKAKREKCGLKANCKTCVKAQRHEWYLRNAEREIAKTEQWQRANPEKKKEYAKTTYYKNHASRRSRANAAYAAGKENICEGLRRRYAENEEFRQKRLDSCKVSQERRVEAIKEYGKKYRENNRPKCNVWANDARCRKMNAPGVCTAEQWLEILEYFNHHCAYCLRHEGEVGRLAQDHMTPLTRGGTNDPDNLVPACKSCNSKKHNYTVLEFAGGIRLPRNKQLIAF